MIEKEVKPAEEQANVVPEEMNELDQSQVQEAEEAADPPVEKPDIKP